MEVQLGRNPEGWEDGRVFRAVGGLARSREAVRDAAGPVKRKWKLRGGLTRCV